MTNAPTRKRPHTPRTPRTRAANAQRRSDHMPAPPTNTPELQALSDALKAGFNHSPQAGMAVLDRALMRRHIHLTREGSRVCILCGALRPKAGRS